MYSHDEVYTSMYAAGYRVGSVFTSLWDGQEKTVGDLRRFLQPSEDQNLAVALFHLQNDSPHQAPLYFLIAHFWMNLVGHLPAAMRGLAAVFGCLSIPAMYWLGRELFQSSRTAWLAAALFAISPFHILFSQDARPYSLWTLAMLLSSAALLRAMHRNTRSAWMIYGLTLALGIYSHQLFLLVMAAHAVYFAALHLFHHRQRYAGFLLAGLFAFLAYLPWLYFVIARWQAVIEQVSVLNMQTAWYRFIQRWILLFSSPLIDLDLNSNTANLVPYFLRLLVLIFVAYACLSLARSASPGEKLFLASIYIMTSGMFIVLDLAFGGMRSITGRYYVPANVATLLVAASFLAPRLDREPSPERSLWKAVFGLLVAAALLSNLNSLQAETWWTKELSRVKMELIREIDREQTMLIVSGIHPTNLGDVLMLSAEIDADVRFLLYRDPGQVSYPGQYRNVYWFPASYDELRAVSQANGLRVTEVLPGVLWRIEGREK